MSTESEIHFDAVDDALRRLDADTDPAEAHGILCGMICATGRGDLPNWLNQVIGEPEEGKSIPNPEFIKTLEELHKQTLEQISSGNYALQLLLPHDEDSIDDRVDDLSYWCQGFLFGLSFCGITNFDNLPEEAREVVNDIVEISQSQYQAADNENENETAYAEIVEYLRIGVIVIFSELNKSDFPNIKPTVH